jgi:type III secretion system YscQ/HrcQ family protein
VAVLGALHALLARIDGARIAQSVGELVGQHGGVCDVRTAVGWGEPARRDGFVLGFESDDGRVRFALELERDLVGVVVAALLERPARICAPTAPLDSALAGAAAAVVAHVLRREGIIVRPLGPGALRGAPGERRAEVSASLFLGDRAYGVRASIEWPPTLPTPDPAATTRLRSLADLPLTLPVVGAVAALEREALEALRPGDVLLPGSGWTLSVGFEGTAVLCAPASDRGIEVALGEQRGLVVQGIRAVCLDEEMSMGRSESNENQSSAEVALEAPVLVRVEVGAVTLTAKEWSAVGPGDVLPLARRIGDAAVLRVAGIEVARGELVDVEGELGVRISALVARS